MRKHVAAIGVASLLVGVGVTVATPAVAVSFGPELSLSPVSQQNAVRSALDYLEMSGFSRSGLIDQLEYEGFTQAQYGVAAVGL